MYAWARATVVTTGSIAFLGFTFGDYMNKIAPLGGASSTLDAALSIVLLTLVNLVGIREAKVTQNLLTALEVLTLIAIIVTGLWLVAPAWPVPTQAALQPPVGRSNRPCRCRRERARVPFSRGRIVVAIGSLYRPLLETARRTGVDIEPALVELGLDGARMADPNLRLSEAQGRALVRSMVALTGDREIGLHAVELFALGDVDLIGYLARNAPHPLAALQLIARYSRLIGDTADFDVAHADGLVTLSFRLRGGRLLEPEAADFAAGAGLRIMRELSRGRALPLEVRLARPRPRAPAYYRRFFAVPVVFDAACTALVYPEAALLVPAAHSDQQLLRILEERACEVTAALPEAVTWLDGVRAEIARGLFAGELELANVAQRCGMSERTLRRRLAAAHSSYRALVDEVRRERALALLRSGSQRVSELAQLLGYADATAFARAFRRWTGHSPQAYIVQSRRGALPKAEKALAGPHPARASVPSSSQVGAARARHTRRKQR